MKEARIALFRNHGGYKHDEGSKPGALIRIAPPLRRSHYTALMPFKASGEEILSRSPPDLKVKPKIPEGSALVTEASKKTKEWSRSSSQDLYMELNEWDYMSDKRWPAFEDAAKEINKLFYDDVPKSCTCPKGEADIS